MVWSFERQETRFEQQVVARRWALEAKPGKVFCLVVAVLFRSLNPCESMAPRSKRLVDQGYKHLCAASYPVAIQSLTAALDKDPKNAEAMRYLGYALVRSGQAELAIARFEALIKTGKAGAEDRAGLGDALYY